MSLDYPLEAQFAVELIREQLPPKAPDVNWKEACDKAEIVIDRELQHIKTYKGKPEELEKQLDKDQKEFTAVFEEALKKKAKGRRVEIIGTKAAAYYDVTVKLDPKKGTAFYLPVLQYELLKASGGLDDERNWHEVASPRLSLVGSFHFRGRWGDFTRITGIITIIKDDQEVTVSSGK